MILRQGRNTEEATPNALQLAVVDRLEEFANVERDDSAALVTRNLFKGLKSEMDIAFSASCSRQDAPISQDAPAEIGCRKA